MEVEDIQDQLNKLKLEIDIIESAERLEDWQILARYNAYRSIKECRLL